MAVQKSTKSEGIWNLEVPQKALFKPTLNEQNNFGIVTLNRNGVS